MRPPIGLASRLVNIATNFTLTTSFIYYSYILRRRILLSNSIIIILFRLILILSTINLIEYLV